MKKILSALLVVSLVFSMCVFAEDTNNAADKVNEFLRELEFLKSLKIPDISLLEKNEITRGEFTALVINTLYPDGIFAIAEGGSVFIDVDNTHKYYSAIKAAKDLGIVKGSSSAQFRPDELVSLTDAVVILVNALGYTAYADVNGGYPSGYYMIGSQIGILKGLNNAEELNGDIAGKLIYNALFVDVTGIESIESDGVNIGVMPDSELLYTVYDIKKYDATVITNVLSTIVNGSTCDENQAVLRDAAGNKYTVYTNDSGIEWLLGRNLTVYIRNNEETGKNEVVHFTESRKMQIVSVNTKDIIGVTANYIECEEEAKTVKLNIEGAICLYNGVFMNVYNNSIFTPKDGIVTFINNDNDSSFDVVEILSFNFMRNDLQSGITHTLNARNIVVDTVDLKSEYITCKWNPQNNINLNYDTALFRIVSSDKNIKTLEDIRTNDIISVAHAPNKVGGKEFYTLAVSRNSITDVANYENETEYIIGINDKDYKVSSSVYSVRNNYSANIVFGSDVTVFLDYTGKIAYFDKLQNIVNNYAYLINAALKTTSDKELVVKVFEVSGSVNTYKVKSNARIDGVSYEDKQEVAEEQLKALSKRPLNYEKLKDSVTGLPYEESISRPVIIKKNSNGEITSINTDNPDYPLILAGKTNLYSDYNEIGYSDDEVSDSDALKAGFRSHRLSGYRAAARSIDGMFFVNSLTYVMCVPDIDTAGLGNYTDYLSNPKGTANAAIDYKILKHHELDREDSNYSFINTSNLKNDVGYDIQGYNIDPDTGIAELVVLRGISGLAQSIDEDDPMAVFLKLTDYYDETLDKHIKKLYYTINGEEELSVIVDTENLFYAYDYIINGAKSSDPDNPFNTDIPALKKGDIIRVLGNNGYLSHIERVYKIDEIDDTYASMSFPGASVGYKNARSYDGATGWRANSASYALYTLIPKYIKGGILYGMQGYQTTSAIDILSPSTYINQFIDVSGVSPVVIDIDSYGNVKVANGTLSDIVTLNESGSLTDASRVIYMHEEYVIKSMIIVNDRR